jgi:hypothetical protein
MRVENNRHTNAHQPRTSHSPIGVSIPPLRHNAIVIVNLRCLNALFLITHCKCICVWCYYV